MSFMALTGTVSTTWALAGTVPHPLLLRGSDNQEELEEQDQEDTTRTCTTQRNHICQDCETHCGGRRCALVLIKDEYLPGTLHEYWVHLITSVCQGSRGSNTYPHSLTEHKRVLAASGEDALADLEVDASAPLQVVAELWSSKRWAPG